MSRLASGDRSSSGTRSTSMNTSFQNSRDTGEYGLGSKGRSRDADSRGRVPTVAPPRPSTHENRSARSVKSPHPQLLPDLAAYRGRKTPHKPGPAFGHA